MKSCLSIAVIKAVVFGLVMIGACGTKTEVANATAITFAAEYTGSFTGAIIDVGPPVILISAGIGTDPAAPFGLTDVSFTHNTSIPNFVGPPFAIQTIFNGSLTLSGLSSNGLTGSYTGTFQLFNDATGGTIHLDLTNLVGSGGLIGFTGFGTADGTVVFSQPLPPSGFDGTFDVRVNAAFGAAPIPAALPLFATGLGALGLVGWRRKRKAALAA